ncbi:aminoacyl-tRNA hydrolase [Streptomyces sp. NPDC020719]|uniref:aminoacyl-tRNA hydrolase n=1 Tax=Streptomyces sp. NPDC020719 TaxID=3154896 RepID=UPI0033F62006
MDGETIPEQPWLIAGLGNPTRWFAGTRHNAGFLVADRLAERHGARFKVRNTHSTVAEVEIAGQRVVVAKPQWTVNRAGRPVAATMRRYGIPLERLVVIQDDLDFPYGVVRLKRGGGPGGHNGPRNITQALGTRDYYRLRFGVGRPPKGLKVNTFVVQKFAEAEREAMPAHLDRCTAAIETLIAQGPDKAQTALHTE